MKRVRMTFEVSVKNAKPGDKVFVVGGRPEIGGWQMAHAKELTTAPDMFPRWSTLVDMEPGPFEYKYVWQHSHGEAEWESTANRSYLGTDGPFCKDGEFNHNECVQKPGSYVCFHGYYAHADWAQQEFANLKSELATLRNTVERQSEDLVHHRTLVKEQEDLLMKQGEVVEKQRAGLEALQAELETQKRSTERLVERLKRELSDFRARAPDAEEIREEVLKKIKEDLPEISARRNDSCHEAAAAPAPVEEAFHDVELEQLQAVFPPTVELSEFIGSQAERRAEVPMDSPKEEKASTMQTPHAPYASRFIGLGGLGGLGNTISFHYPPHPDEKTEKEARQLTEEVLQTLMNSWNSTKEEKLKLLKAAQLRLHPDKGGSNAAMKWYQDWRELHEAWFLKGPQSNVLGEKQQPAG